MSEFTDGLRELADLIDGGKLSYDFIKGDLKQRLPMYLTEIKARAYLLKNHKWFDSINFDNIDGKTKSKDRPDDRFKTNNSGPGRPEPWWYKDRSSRS